MIRIYEGSTLHNAGAVPIEFLLVFDQRTGRLAAHDGLLVVGSPVRGVIGRERKGRFELFDR